MIASAEIGLDFWGMVDDAPRYLPVASDTSPTSVRERSTTSRAKRTQVPATMAAALVSSAIRSRATCQGISASFRPSRFASAARTAGPLSPRAAEVPPAPYDETTAALARAAP